ncbi:helix-turn-helix domain-containing protein [Nocardia sp. alder85J]|uniref:helix-turn-helix domain-containing protein n=1 Tax=Nocardia sp. alder85J TaxID=2862949 RepID=UPI001CD79B69|nr:helix-turn-helix domain-containing protein [Nocardia sp. alder85J]MCX4094746.1 helix-turn-helix domain containing protein [Nocardia sp. alder85J]
MTERRATPTREGPVGREAVAAAVLTHAADLFAERGPAATSIRDIADRAGVNHGLVFRHFGTKDHLVGEVLDHLGAESGALAAAEGFSVTDARFARHLRVLARCILDGYPVEQLQQRFPVMRQLLDRTRAEHADDRTAALAVAHAAAFGLGWQLFEPFLRASTGLQDLPATELGELIATRIGRLLAADDRD